VYNKIMKPLGDLVLVKADVAKTQTSSGLYIQEDWKTTPPTGVVLAVGEKVTLVKPGDKVVFDRYGAVAYDKDEKLCKENQILGIIHETDQA
jgi:chaperonin GroES